MKKEKQTVVEEINDNDEIKDFDLDAKRDILDIITDCPSIVRLGTKEYRVKNMRYYSLYRICKLVTDMKKADETLDTDNAVITALCTDLDAMCEIMAIVLCNHMFEPCDNADERNDELIRKMKIEVMNATYEPNQWAAIILGAIKSIDLSAFFLLKKSVSTLTDSLLERKRKSMEIASQFMEALSLQTQQTS